MKRSASPRKKHVPQRTCVGCRQVNAKRELIRLVRTPQGVFIDPGGKMAGRGAYLHRQRSCWEAALKGALAHALRVELTPEDRMRLEEFLQTLSGDENDGG
ncbi:MAG: YlxR family protein [Anaerolineales bacterium]